MEIVWQTNPTGQGQVGVTYTVQPSAAQITAGSTAISAPPQRSSLPFTGAPLMMEMTASFGLLVAGALAALSAHRAARRAAPASRVH